MTVEEGGNMDLLMESDKINQQNAIKSDVKTSLSEILPLLTKNRLSQLASVYDLRGRSKMAKEELVKQLLYPLTIPGLVEDTLLIATNEEWDFFRTLLNKPFLKTNEVNPSTYRYLMERGLLFLFLKEDKLYFVIPDEVKEAYERIDKAPFIKIRERYQLVHHYILALVNLYGAYPVATLIDIFIKQNADKLSETEFWKIFIRFQFREQLIYRTNNEYIISDYFDSDNYNELTNLLASVKNKPYYIPSKGELLKYSDDLYFEFTPQLARLKKYVLKELCPNKQLVEGLIDDLQLSCEMEEPPQQLLSQFERWGLNFEDINQVNKVMSLLMDVYNHTRIWSNAGHTPAEMFKFSGEIIPSSTQHQSREQVVKVGRNEACPCGSGKKYKKCCGK
jgi:hypothetical protein